jgi:hypothetical protein
VADASEIATLADGVFLVYKVGKIGRGVLKRAKSNLDNVDARLVGMILNCVKSDEGPEYYRYHSHYYYGSESESNTDPAIQSMVKTIGMRGILGKSLKILMLILIPAVVLTVFFWQDLNLSVPDWLLSFRQTILPR